MSKPTTNKFSVEGRHSARNRGHGSKRFDNPAGTTAFTKRSSWTIRRRVLGPPPRRSGLGRSAPGRLASSMPLGGTSGLMSGRPFNPF